MRKTIALLGQPNSGKSTVFNGLTGSHQHVGNWPGKTVECKEGSFSYQGTTYNIIDLPGSYSLSAGSNEEQITTEYIDSGKADLIAILVDSSQLERSLYMYTDYAGIKTPAVLILNLMDISKKKGIHIDIDALQKQTGIPVIGFTASDVSQYDSLKETLRYALEKPHTASADALMDYYKQDPSLSFQTLIDSQSEDDIYSKEKKAVLELEKTDEGLMVSGKHKYEYIDALLAKIVKRQDADPSLNQFDKKALGPHSGKWIAIGIIVAALSLAMVIAAPIMGLAFSIPSLMIV